MSAEAPTVSVLMPVFDPNPAYLRAAVRSILDQSFPDLELIIIEAPSRRSVFDLVGPVSDPRLRVLTNPQRTSLVDQLNSGLHAARGDLIARLDSDDLAEPNRIARQVEFMEAHQEISVLGSQLKIIDRHGSLIGYRCYPQGHERIVAMMRIYNPIAHPAVMFRSKTIRSQGGYRWAVEGVNEDYELWCRLAKAGYGFATHPEPLTRYRVHPGSIKSNRVRSMLRSTIMVKKFHWGRDLGVGGLLRLALEHLLLVVPERLVLRLFQATQFRATLCPPE